MEVELEVEMFWRCNFRVKTQFPRPAPPRDWSLHPDDILCNPFLWICPDSYQISAAPLFVFTEIRYCYKILSGRGERREERGQVQPSMLVIITLDCRADCAVINTLGNIWWASRREAVRPCSPSWLKRIENSTVVCLHLTWIMIKWSLIISEDIQKYILEY